MSDSIDIFEKSINQSISNTNVSVPWVEKYRPKELSDMVLVKKTKDMLQSMIDSKDLRSMSLFGEPGIGKSTLAKLLSNTLNCETLFIPCGTDGTVDVVRNRIEPFCDSISSGRIKCIILDEFDSASGGNAAANGMQKSLRSLMEAYTDVRFIITCNFPQKIIEPIFSRCPKIHIGFTLKDVANRIKYIFEQEKIEFDRDTACEFMKKYAEPKMPDIRSIINLAQLFCQSGKLILNDDSIQNVGNTLIKDFSNNILNYIASGKNCIDICRYITSNSQIYGGDFEVLAKYMSDSVIDLNMDVVFITVLADYSYRMSQVTDPSLQMKGAVIKMCNMIKTK